MLELIVQICRITNDEFPGWVECKLTDARGNEHVFLEKVSVVTEAALTSASEYPQPGFIACRIIDRRVNADNRDIVEVETGAVGGVASVAGRDRFEVFLDQLRGLSFE